MDLNKLKCFQAVAEKGGLQAGARHLNLTSSAVYQSIKKLEDDMQMHLFFRSGKKYILTDEGRALQELFERFLWDFSQFQEAVRPSSDAVTGEMRIGLPLNFSKSVFVPLMQKFQELYPKVQFHLTIAETRRLLEQVAAFELDFAITDDSIPSEYLPKIALKEVFKEELVMVCSRAFAKTHEEELKNLKTMKELIHLDYSKNLPLIQRWYKLHYKRQIKISQFHSIDNVETMVEALRAGMGLGIIPKGLLDHAPLGKELITISIQTGSLYNPLLLVQEANYINNNLLKRFLTFMYTSLDLK